LLIACCVALLYLRKAISHWPLAKGQQLMAAQSAERTSE